MPRLPALPIARSREFWKRTGAIFMQNFRTTHEPKWRVTASDSTVFLVDGQEVEAIVTFYVSKRPISWW